MVLSNSGSIPGHDVIMNAPIFFKQTSFSMHYLVKPRNALNATLVVLKAKL